jgi:predicted short-subunit dehydrogenase-like oxidoreductase (DUF2520 family)
VAFLGQGRVVENVAMLEPAAFVMITVPDDAIAAVARQLAASGTLTPGTIVFHCSGSLGSDILEPARARDAQLASVHPLKTFADPATAAASFEGTACGLEGDAEACQRLERLMTEAGGRVFRLQPGGKLLYHAGSVIACNYLTALMDMAVQCQEASGLTRAQALELLLPMARETLENIARFGHEKALTGPISRGDAGLVARQAEAVGNWNPQVGVVYNALGLAAVELARRRGGLTPDALEAMTRSLALTKIPTRRATPPKDPAGDL